MTSEEHHSQEFEPQPTYRETLDRFIRESGFNQDEQLHSIRTVAIELVNTDDHESAKALVKDFQIHGEEIVSQASDQDYADAQIGLILATATFRLDIGSIDGCIDDLNDAALYADMGYSQLADQLVQAIDELSNK